MNRPDRPMYVPWRSRLRPGEPRPQSGAPAPKPPSAPRPGIAARWKARDRVRTAGA
ncbi:MAG: hypothetical protein IPH30_10730 [Betaproteobacteria bacterium]|nr:hypothetical protein [Betaproteobacteria bacterium]